MSEAKDIHTQLSDALAELNEHSCKRCGFDQRQDYNPVSEDILKDYFKASLAQAPFTKTYKLYGGTIAVEFAEPTGKLLRLQERAIMTRAQEKRASMSDSADFAMLASLSSVMQVPKEGDPKVIYTADEAKRVQILEAMEVPEEILNMTLILLQAIRATFTQFSRLCADLIVASQDENFWKGDGRN